MLGSHSQQWSQREEDLPSFCKRRKSTHFQRHTWQIATAYNVFVEGSVPVPLGFSKAQAVPCVESPGNNEVPSSCTFMTGFCQPRVHSLCTGHGGMCSTVSRYYGVGRISTQLWAHIAQQYSNASAVD